MRGSIYNLRFAIYDLCSLYRQSEFVNRKSIFTHLLIYTISLIFIAGCIIENQPARALEKFEIPIHQGGQTTNKIPFQMPQLTPPVFPARIINIRDYGAIGDGKTINTTAFAQAIADCAKAGGGQVLVPEGIWLTGPIHLKSNINLHIAENAQIRFSTNFDHYLPKVFTRWEGTEMKTHSPLIYAHNCTNIAITGPGMLDGQGKPWWDKNLRQKIRRPSFIQPINCKNVLLDGFTITSGPMWTIHPLYCENVIIRNLKIQTQGPNNDGINPDSCKNVLIENCYISTGDDCIALKSGRDEDGWRVGKPCENIIIRNCIMKDGHGAVVIGSEMSGDVRNVLVQNCIFDGTDRGIRIKSRRGRGGTVENIWFENIKMRKIKKQAIRLNMLYTCGPTPPTKKPPTFRNIHIRNITCQQAMTAVEITGLPENPIQNITLENLSISAQKHLTCTHVSTLKLINVKITTQNGNEQMSKSLQKQRATTPKYEVHNTTYDIRNTSYLPHSLLSHRVNCRLCSR